MPDVTVTIGAKNALLKTGLEEGKHYVQEFGQEVRQTMAGAFAGYAIFEDLKQLGERAKRVLSQADVLGSTPEDIQMLGNAAKETDDKIGDLTTELDKLRKSAQLAAVEGDQKMLDSFARLGVGIEDLREKNAAEIFYQIADGIKAGKDAGNEMVDVTQVMGRNAGNLIGLLKKGSEGIRELGREGVVMTQSELESLKQSYETLEHVWHGFINLLAGGFDFVIAKVEKLLAYLGWLGSYVIGNSTWQENFARAIVQLDHPEVTKNNYAAPAAGGVRDAEDLASDPGGQKAKSAAATLATIRSENAQKLAAIKDEAARKQLTLAQQLEALRRDQADLEVQWVFSAAKTAEDLRDLAAARVQNAQDIVRVEGEITAEAQKQAKAAEDHARAEAKIREGLDSDRKAAIQEKSVAAAKERLAQLEAGLHAIQADSLRAMGGTLSGVNYRVLGSGNPLQEQIGVLRNSLKVQEETLSTLKGRPDAPQQGLTSQLAQWGSNRGTLGGNSGAGNGGIWSRLFNAPRG